MKNTEMFLFFNSGYEIEYSLGTNENERFFSRHTTEFGLGAVAWAWYPE